MTAHSCVQILTALLAERVKSELTGYRVTLAAHPAAVTSRPGRRAGIVTIADRVLDLVLWVDALGDNTVESDSGLLVELRMVLRSSELDGAIGDIAGDSVETTEEDLRDEDSGTMWEVLQRADELLDELEQLVLDTGSTVLVDDLQRALRIYRNDPFNR